MNPLRPFFVSIIALLAFVITGCVNQPPRPAWRFLQRNPSRIAVLPATNQTTNAGAPLVIDKAWQEALQKAGFNVVSADSVVTYASANGILLADVQKAPAAKVGEDLHVDYILKNEIVDWGSKYQVIRSVAVVSCRSRLIDVRSGAVVWAHDWIADDGGQSGIEQALVSALINSMFDTPSRLAVQGVGLSASFMPYPGTAPANATER